MKELETGRGVSYFMKWPLEEANQGKTINGAYIHIYIFDQRPATDPFCSGTNKLNLFGPKTIPASSSRNLFEPAASGYSG